MCVFTPSIYIYMYVLYIKAIKFTYVLVGVIIEGMQVVFIVGVSVVIAVNGKI